MTARSKVIAAVAVLGAAVGAGVAAALIGRDHRPARLASSSSTADYNAGDSGVTVHSVRPSQADPSVTGPDAPSLAMFARGSKASAVLVVFLPGTGGDPSCCTLFLRRAVSLGYRAIGLTYDNQTAVGARCLDNLRCFGTVRWNVFDGSHPSAYSYLPPRDGIKDRLASLLAYLAARYPGEGWARFLRAGEPVWSSIVISGHSQGGGEAAFIGSVRRMRGVATLSSPPDTDLSHQPATWLASVAHGRTALDKFVGFVHSGDPFYSRIVADWNAMQLGSLGPLTSGDTTRSPYGHTHELISSAPLPPVILAAHDSTAVDTATPKCPDGSPEYAPVWGYMLEVSGGLPVRVGAAGCAKG